MSRKKQSTKCLGLLKGNKMKPTFLNTHIWTFSYMERKPQRLSTDSRAYLIEEASP